MRLVIELKRGGDPAAVVLNQLYKHTPMQNSFGMNMVALVNGVPRTLGLKELIHHYVDHQRDVIVRRTQYELRQAEARAHVLEGLLIALDNLDAVIALIRGSADPVEAKAGLIENFELSDIQAQAILDMRLQRLTALESDKIRAEHAELQDKIAELRAILGDPSRIDGLIVDELSEIEDKYANERRTELTHFEGDLNIEDVIADQQMVVSLTNSGYAKRLPLATYRQQRRGGIGVMGMNLKEEDYIEHLHICSTHDFLLFFTNRGKVYRLKVYELPEGSRTHRGQALVNVLPLRDGERVMAVIPTRDFKEDKFLVFATAGGQIKKTEFLEYNTKIKADGIIAIKVKDDDELVQVRLTSGEDDILMVSKSGNASRFSESQVRPMGRGTGGVRGMNVSKKLPDGAQEPRPGNGHRARRLAALRRHRERLRQAHRGAGVSGQGPRHPGRPHDPDDREEGRPRRRADRPRAPGPPLHLAERHGPAHQRRRHLAHGPRDAGRPRHEHEGGRLRLSRRPRRRVLDAGERRRDDEPSIQEELEEAEAAGE